MWAALILLTACRGAGTRFEEHATIPFTRAFGLVFVAVSLGDGPPLFSLLDTGASASAIDGARARELPSLGTGEVMGTTGSMQVEMVEVGGLRLGSVELPVLRATRRDLGGLLSPEGRRVEMILGSDALAGFAVTVDFRSGMIEVSEDSREDDAEGVPMVLDNGIPTIAATVGGVEMWLRIDTGASLFETEDVYVNVPTRTWEALRARDPELKPTSHLQGTGANGEAVALPVAKVKGARIGPVELESVFVIVQPEVGYFTDPEAKGFVGNNFLEKVGRVTLDYPAERFRSKGELSRTVRRRDALDLRERGPE